MDDKLEKLFSNKFILSCDCILYTLTISGNEYIYRDRHNCVDESIRNKSRWTNHQSSYHIKFEEVLNVMEDDIQTEFLFHLDYFTGGENG